MAGWSIAIQQDRELSGESRQWGNWESALLLTSCKYCVEKHGTVAPIQMVETKLSVHPNCYCVYVPTSVCSCTWQKPRAKWIPAWTAPVWVPANF